MTQAVCDSGPLTHLWQIELWQVFSTFQALHLTARVAQEVREHVPLEQMTTLANCALHIHDIPQREIETQSQAFSPDLEDADVSTLLLAQQVTPELVLTDDLDLRRAVESQGQATMGSVGILLRAYAANLLDQQALNQAIDSLFVHSTLYLSPNFKSYVRELIAEMLAC
jgi:predicted nucleic acid-binding protein